jgi:hypothetical protein
MSSSINRLTCTGQSWLARPLRGADARNVEALLRSAAKSIDPARLPVSVLPLTTRTATSRRCTTFRILAGADDSDPSSMAF